MKNSRLSLDKIQQQKNPEHNILESTELNFAAENRGPMIIDAISPEELMQNIVPANDSNKKKTKKASEPVATLATPEIIDDLSDITKELTESTEIIDG